MPKPTSEMATPPGPPPTGTLGTSGHWVQTQFLAITWAAVSVQVVDRGCPSRPFQSLRPTS